jgi:hypothetical protein
MAMMTVALAAGLTVTWSLAWAIISLIWGVQRLQWRLRWWDRRYLLENTPLDDLVEFSSVQPDPATFRAIIDFYSLTFGHDQVDGAADGTFHDDFSLMPVVG